MRGRSLQRHQPVAPSAFLAGRALAAEHVVYSCWWRNHFSVLAGPPKRSALKAGRAAGWSVAGGGGNPCRWAGAVARGSSSTPSPGW